MTEPGADAKHLEFLRDRMRETFAAHNDAEYLKFERVGAPPGTRPDLYAFALLEHLCPSDRNIIAGAEHDKIWLEVDERRLAAVFNEQAIVTLLRCGVLHDRDTRSLYMHV